MRLDAALRSNLRVIVELLSIRNDPNRSSSRGVTPLHVAVRYDTLEAAEVLLDAGCDPNVAVPFARWTGTLSDVDGRPRDEHENALLAPWDLARSADMRELLEAYGAVPASAARDR